MLKLTMDTPVNTEDYLAIMRLNNLVYFEKEKLIREFKIEEARLEGIKKNILDYMSFMSDEYCGKLTYETARNFLVSHEGVPDSEFLVYEDYGKTKKYSFDDKVREKIFDKGYAPFFFSMYNEYINNLSTINTVRTFVNGIRDTKYLTNSGEVISSIPFYYSIAKTNRIYTKNQSVQGLPLSFCNNIVAVKDYFILWFDFSQIDFRVAWNTILRYTSENAKVEHEDTPDYYLMFAKELYKSLNKDFDIDKYKEDRPKYKTGTLATLYGCSVNTILDSVKDREFAGQLHEYFNSDTNYGYKKYKDLLKRNIENGLMFSAKTYFGTEMYLDPKDRGVLNAGLNRPIQGTTADIMKVMTLEIYNRVQKHINNPMKFYPILNRHDENLFMCHKDTIPFLYEFIDCTRIQVDDWDPLEFQWSAGYNYKVEDEELVKSIKSSMNGHKLTIAKKTKPKTSYTPFTNAVKISVTTYHENGYYYTMLLDEDINRATFFIDRKPIHFQKWVDVYLDNEPSWYKEEHDRVIFIANSNGYCIKNNIEFVVKYDNSLELNTMASMIMNSVVKEYCRRQLKIEPSDYLIEHSNDNLRKEIKFDWKIMI